MKVSFGQLYTVKELPVRTEKQLQIEKKIDDVFESRHKQNGLDSGIERTLDEMLENDMEANVRLTHKKNGDVQLELEERKHIDNDPLTDNIIAPKDKIKLTLSKNLSPREIQKKLTAYANKCRELAKYYYLQAPNIIAERMSKYSKEELEARNKALNEI